MASFRGVSHTTELSRGSSSHGMTALGLQHFNQMIHTIFTAILVLIAFTQTSLAQDRVEVDSRPAVIFIPGAYGTALRDRVSKNRIYVTVGEAIAGSEALSLFQKELQTPRGPEVEPDGVLERISVIPGIYGVDVYGGIIDKLRTIRSTQVIPFAYDWRQDLHRSVEQLAKLIERLKKAGAPSIQFVAHSMGGLIAAYYIGYGTQDPMSASLNWDGVRNVNGLVVFGTPFQGAFGMFRDMNRGASFPMVGHLFPAEAVASFPAFYHTLPFRGARVLDGAGNSSKIPLADVKFWQRHRLGLFANSNLPATILKNRLDFVTTQLQRGLKFVELLRFESAGALIPKELKVMNVVGSGSPTVDTAYELRSANLSRFVFDSDKLENHGLQVERLKSDGDGTVTVRSQSLPILLRSQAIAVSSKETHDRLVADEKAQTAMLEFLRRGRNRK